MLPCKRICDFSVKVVVIEWVCVRGVSHEGCVVRWAEKLPVGGKGFLFGFKVYFDGLYFLLVKGFISDVRVVSQCFPHFLIIKHAYSEFNVVFIRHVPVR